MLNNETALEERREEEVEVLKAIYSQDFEDLREKDVWKVKRPPEFLLTIYPGHDSKANDTDDKEKCFVTLHFKLGLEYPLQPALDMQSSSCRGISDQLVEELISNLKKLAVSLQGEVMITELAQSASAWLLEHKNPKPFASFYEEMQSRNKAEEEEKAQRLKSEMEHNAKMELKEQENVRLEVARMMEELKVDKLKRKEEEKQRRLESLQDVQELRPRHRSQRRTSSAKSSSESQSEVLAASLPDLKFVHHGESVKIDNLVKLGGNVLGGSVHMGHFSLGNRVVAVKEWTLRTRISAKKKAGSIGSNEKIHDQDSLLKQISSIEQEMSSIQKLSHANVVQYQAMTYQKQPGQVKLFLIENFALGSNLSFFLSENIPLQPELLKYYAKGILEAMDFMHEHNIVHRDLRDSSVFCNSQGLVQVGDFSIDKRVRDLVQNSQEGDDRFPIAIGRGGKKTDIYRYGLLVLSLAVGEIVQDPRIPKFLPPDLTDFLRKCLIRDEKDRWGSRKLLNHNWLKQQIERSPLRDRASADRDEHDIVEVDEEYVEEPVAVPFKLVGTGQSRLHNEFKFISQIGKGGFGEVMKVRNNLDGQVYAIKKINLNKNKQATRKLMREVKLLSRLNHEHVVRYYTSWIEVTTVKEEKNEVETSFEEESVESSTPGKSMTKASANKNPLWKNILNLQQPLFLNADDSKLFSNTDGFSFSSHLLQDAESGPDDDTSDEEDDSDDVFGTSFLPHSNKDSDSDSNVVVFQDDDDDTANQKSTDLSISSGDSKPISEENQTPESSKDEKIEFHIMYIQMEYCDKQTLRNAIDGGLNVDSQRLWRMFREIIEGLVHIHSQGMIHRDLKPVNIFIDSNDHVKIGDFGLATTNLSRDINATPIPGSESLDNTLELTGNVGTTMYTAPEIDTKCTKYFTYTQKVDIYSLGIIFFEMCNPMGITAMERRMVLGKLRTKDIVLPEDRNLTMQQEYIIKWLLNHDPAKRPNSQELLQSDYLPPLQVEEAEMRETIRQTLANQQSKAYRHLIDSCVLQEMTLAQDISYDIEVNKDITKPLAKKSLMESFLAQEYVRRITEQVFQRHGAVSVQVGHLLPKSKLKVHEKPNVVQVMTKGGNVVTLPYDLRVSFARFLARSQITNMKRYCIAPVFREFQIYGYHPREHIECAFDIVSPCQGSFLADAEVLSTVDELLNELNSESVDPSHIIRINHTQLIRGILLGCNISEEYHLDIFKLIMEGSGWSKTERNTNLLSLGLSESAVETFLNLLEHEGTITKISGILKHLIRRKSSGSEDIKKALNDLDSIISRTKDLGVKCQVIVSPSLVYNPGHFSGMICQVVRKKKKGHDIVAAGGRYDKLINVFASSIDLGKIEGERDTNKTAVGISLSMDKLVSLSSNMCESFSSAEVMIYSENHMFGVVKEKTELATRLWRLGIKCMMADIFHTLDETQENAYMFGASFLIIIRDMDGMVRVRCLEKDNRFHEKKVSMQEVPQFIVKNLKAQNQDTSDAQGLGFQRSESVRINAENRHAGCQVNYNLRFIDKSKSNMFGKKRLEATINAKVATTLDRFVSNTVVEVLALPFCKSEVITLAHSLEFDNPDEFKTSVAGLSDKLTMQKKVISRICEEIYNLKFEKKCDVVLLYSVEEHLFVPLIF